MRNTVLGAVLSATTFAFIATFANGGSATWDLNPGSADWFTATNWTPTTVPNGPTDTATFNVSNITSIGVTSRADPPVTELGSLVFNAGASAFTMRIFEAFELDGAGIVNNSGVTQNFFVFSDVFLMRFHNGATAGEQTVFDLSAGFNINSTQISFEDHSSANHGTFNVPGGSNGAYIYFTNNSTADHGTFILGGGSGESDQFIGGHVFFNSTSTAANSTLVANGSHRVGGIGVGATIDFENKATAGNSTLIALGSNDEAGGTIRFHGDSTGGAARVEVFGTGFLDISDHNAPGLTIGSLEGTGNVFLGSNNLTVGSNNLGTTFSGVIQDGGQNGGRGGSLTKIGTGTLALNGTNTYTGNTNVNGGALMIDGSIKSNTFVNQHGTLAGIGTINANITVNRGGTVSPGDAPGTLTVNNYTQRQGGTLLINIAGPNAGQFSVLNVLGTANLNGLLDPVLLNGFVPTIGESFIFLDYGAVTGSLFIFDRNIDSAAEHWDVTYEAKDAILTVALGNVPIPDWGSTFPLFMLSLLGLATYGRLLLCNSR